MLLVISAQCRKKRFARTQNIYINYENVSREINNFVSFTWNVHSVTIAANEENFWRIYDIYYFFSALAKISNFGGLEPRDWEWLLAISVEKTTDCRASEIYFKNLFKDFSCYNLKNMSPSYFVQGRAVHVQSVPVHVQNRTEVLSRPLLLWLFGEYWFCLSAMSMIIIGPSLLY
jgi:hypothetical protein